MPNGLFLPFGFWDVHPSHRHWFKGFGFECFSETARLPSRSPLKLTHGHPVDSCRFSSLVGVDGVVRLLVAILHYRAGCRGSRTGVSGSSVGPLTKFLLHFTRHPQVAFSCCVELPLHPKFPKAKGLRRWGILLLLLPIV